MLVRYCATHVRHFGYPRLLGLRWNGWVISTVGGLCEACRERERSRWDADPYGEVLVPVPVELGPRMLGWRVIVVAIAGALAAVVATLVLLVAPPSDLIPAGGDPGLFSSGARLAGPPPAQAEPPSEPPVLSQRNDEAPPMRRMPAPRAAPRPRPIVVAAARPPVSGGCAMAAGPVPPARIDVRPVAALTAVQSP